VTTATTTAVTGTATADDRARVEHRRELPGVAAGAGWWNGGRSTDDATAHPDTTASRCRDRAVLPAWSGHRVQGAVHTALPTGQAPAAIGTVVRVRHCASTSIPGAAASQSRAPEVTASATSDSHSEAATGTGTTTSTPASAGTSATGGTTTGGTSWAAGRGRDDLLHRGRLRDLSDPPTRPAFGLETIHSLTHWRVCWMR
jgi:hypothetical protein